MIDGKVKGYFLLGQNPAVGSAHGRAQRLGMANLDWLVVRDLFMIESATFWKNAPGGRHRRDRAGGVPHRGVLPARRLARGEGGHVHPDPAAAAVAGEGRRAAGRLPLRAVVLLPPRPAAAGEAGRLRRAARPGAARPGLGLPDARRARRAERRGGAAGDQRVRRGHRPPAVGVRRGEGRRLHRGRLLDLHRGVRRRRQPGRPPQVPARAGLGGRRVGLGLAGEPAHPLQPRLRRPARAGRGASARRYVWWDADEGRVDRPRRAGLREDQAAVVPAAGRTRRRRRRSPATTRSSCRATARAGCTRRTGLLDGPLPTHYEPAESPVRNPLYGQQANPTRKVVRRTR